MLAPFPTMLVTDNIIPNDRRQIKIAENEGQGTRRNVAVPVDQCEAELGNLARNDFRRRRIGVVAVIQVYGKGTLRGGDNCQHMS